MSLPRLAVLDDGQFVRSYAGSIHPVAATFHRFVEAVARSGAFARVRYMVPVRGLRIWESDPLLPEIDQDVLEIVPTAPFGGIADYLVRNPYLAMRNWQPIDSAITDSDLVWLRLPASNALLTLVAARRRRVPYFGWVAGSVGDVARAQQRPVPLSLAARAVGAIYDEMTRVAEHGGPVMALGAEHFNSVLGAADVEATRAAGPPPEGPPWTIVWAGRMAPEKGLPVLLDAFGRLLSEGTEAQLLLVGDGVERPLVERMAAALPAGSVRFEGYVGDFNQYMSLLRGGHVLAHPSGAEAVPKVIVEAMAAGLPIVATPVGGVAEILGNGERGRIVPGSDAAALAQALQELLADASSRAVLRERGLAWAADHTGERQAERLVAWLRTEFPGLSW